MAAEDLAIRIRAMGAAQAAGAVTDVTDATREWGDETESASTRSQKALKGAAVAIAALGTAALGLAGKGLSDALNIEEAQSKMQAQLGASSQDAERLGKLSGDLYAGAYGESLEEVNNAVVQVGQNMGRLSRMTDADVKKSTAAVLNLASAFGASDQEITRTVGALMRNGMAGSVDEALDLVTRGFQRGADKGGEFLDTLNEYSQPMKSLGFDAKAFTSMLVQGADAGVYSVDKIGDAFKEFSILAIDGSQATKDAYKAIGLDADAMAQKVAAGGPTAKQATGEIIAALKGVSDPVKREAAGVALFGSMWEDIGDKAILGLDPATNALGHVQGAAKRLDSTLGGSTSGSLSAFSRQLQMGLAGVATTYLLPALKDVMAVVKDIGGPIGALGAALGVGEEHGKLLAAALIGLALVIGVLKVGTIAYNAVLGLAVVLQWRYVAALGAQAVASGAVTAAQWLLNAALTANPIGAVVVAIAALVAGFVVAYKRVGWFRNAVDAVWSALKAAGGWIAGNWKILLAPLVGPIMLGVVAFNRLKGAGGAIVTFLKSLPSKMVSALSTVASVLTAPFRAGFNGIARLWNSTVGSISFKLPGWVPGLGGKGFSMPKIPEMYAGGAVVRGGLSWVGERGPELLNLPAGAEVTNSRTSLELAHAPNFAGSSPARERATVGTSGGGGQVGDIYVYIDGEEIAMRMERRMRTQKAITGRPAFR